MRPLMELLWTRAPCDQTWLCCQPGTRQRSGSAASAFLVSFPHCTLALPACCALTECEHVWQLRKPRAREGPSLRSKTRSSLAPGHPLVICGALLTACRLQAGSEHGWPWHEPATPVRACSFCVC